jgi:hypothetical protein
MTLSEHKLIVHSIMLNVLLSVNEIIDICTNYEMKFYVKKKVILNSVYFDTSSHMNRHFIQSIWNVWNLKDFDITLF